MALSLGAPPELPCPHIGNHCTVQIVLFSFRLELCDLVAKSAYPHYERVMDLV